jgi:hypothetical protein
MVAPLFFILTIDEANMRRGNFRTHGLLSPCIKILDDGTVADCEKRFINLTSNPPTRCHSTCEEYKKFLIEIEKQKEAERERKKSEPIPRRKYNNFCNVWIQI